MIFLVKRVGEGRARELILRGNTITADDARNLGLVSLTVPAADLERAADALIQELLDQNSSTSMALCKEMLSKLHGMNIVDALDFAANMNAAARMTPDCKQGISAFLNKQKLTW
jgi:methylglutaconyl-CoA hydratase